MRKEYTTVKIPLELSRRLDEHIENLGYRSRADIVNDAIRRFLESRPEHEEENPLHSEKTESGRQSNQTVSSTG